MAVLGIFLGASVLQLSHSDSMHQHSQAQILQPSGDFAAFETFCSRRLVTRTLRQAGWKVVRILGMSAHAEETDTGYRQD